MSQDILRKTKTIRKRYDRIAGIYDLMESFMEMSLPKWRLELIREVRGTVLEVGVGTGKNLPYYPEHVELYAIDFSSRMIQKARQKLDNSRKAHLFAMDAQQMAFPDNTFDTVVTSCVFCSVPDPLAGLREIRRVCKPWGRVVMLEHVRSGHPFIGPLMDVLNPIPLTIYGANINRNTVHNLRLAGFRNISVTDLWFDIVIKIIAVNEK